MFVIPLHLGINQAAQRVHGDCPPPVLADIDQNGDAPLQQTFCLGVLAEVEGIQAERNQDGCNFIRVSGLLVIIEGFLVVGDRAGVVALLVENKPQAELRIRVDTRYIIVRSKPGQALQPFLAQSLGALE